MDSDEKTLALIEELVALTRFTARDAMERALRATLRDERHQLAYELSDGSHTQTQVALAAGLSQSAMSDLWKKWRQMGLLTVRGTTNQHLVSLSDLGWDIPAAVPSRARQAKKDEATNDIKQ